MKTTSIFKTMLLVAFATCLPLAAMAQWGVARNSQQQGQPQQQQKKQKQVGPNDPLVTVGILHTGDFYKTAAGVGLGLMCNVGRTTNFINGSVGVEFVEHIGGDPRPADQRGKLPVIGMGGQVVVPAVAKLQLFRTSKWTKFWIGCGIEMGFKAYESKTLKDYYPEGGAMNKSSFAVVPTIGWRMRNVDIGFYYKHYTKKPFNHSLDGHKDLGKDVARIGYHFAYYF